MNSLLGPNVFIKENGGAVFLAKAYRSPYDPSGIDLRKSADDGQPLIQLNPQHKISKIYKEIAEKIKQSF